MKQHEVTVPERFNAFLSPCCLKKRARVSSDCSRSYEKELSFRAEGQPRFFNRNASDERLYYKGANKRAAFVRATTTLL